MMKRMIKLIICAAAVMSLSACGRETVEVSVVDGHTTTVVEVTKSDTVEQILAEAEIIVKDKDFVSPSLDTTVDENGSIIKITRGCNIEIVENDGETTALYMEGKTVGDALKEAGITIGKYDLINHDCNMYLTDGLEISYTRRVSVKLLVDDEERNVITQAKNVAELLEECGINLDENDRINAAYEDVLSEDDRIVIERVNVEIVTETQEVDYDVKTEYSGSMYEGQSYVKQEGVKGEKEVKYEVTYVDNEEESRRQVSEEWIVSPVDRVVVYGTKKKETSGKTVVSKEAVYDCDGSGHGYYIITYSDGSVAYEDF